VWDNGLGRAMVSVVFETMVRKSCAIHSRP
jgi:hypothetical protein